MRKRRITLVLLLLVFCVLPLAANAAALELPSALKTIQAEVFYGDTSLDEVKLPETLERIESRAFANSSVREINLPASLAYIADNAFDGAPLKTVHASNGTYAYQWAVEHGYIHPVTSVTLSQFIATIAKGDTLSLTATVAPGDATNKAVTWSSSNTNVATVDSTGKVTAKAGGTAIITVKTVDGGKTSDCSVTVDSITVTGGTKNTGIVCRNIYIYASKSWTATTTDSWLTMYNTTDSSKKAKTISGDAGEGVPAYVWLEQLPLDVESRTGKITFTSGVATYVLSIVQARTDAPVTGITISPTSKVLAVGQQMTMTAAFSPTYATDRRLTWSIDDSTRATISANGEKCTLLAEHAGTANVTVKSTDGGFTATCQVTIVNHNISPTSTVMALGANRNITSTIMPATLSDFTCNWTSSDTSVVAIDTATTTIQKPVINLNAKKAGTAVITGTTKVGGAKCTYTVTVVSTTLNKTSLSLVVDGSETLKATVNPSQYNGAANGATWSSSNDKVAVVDQNGKVTAKGAGTATITATSKYGGAKATCDVTVANKTISLNKTSFTGGNASGGGDTITVTANADWTAQSDSGWLTFTPASGKSGTTNVTVNYAKNTTAALRNGKITFTCGSATATYSLSQNPYSLTLSPTEQKGVSENGASYTVTITANGSWTASSEADWLTVTPTSGNRNGSITVTAAANTESSSRAGNIVVKCGGVVQTYRLHQRAYFSLSLSSTSVSGGYPDGGTVSVNVTNNAAWTATSKNDWITISPTSGNSGTTKVTLTYAKNTTTAPRTGTVTFACGNATIGTKTVIYSLTQNKHTVTLNPTTQTGVSPDGTAYTITVTANGAWTAKSDSTWLTLGTTSGSGNGTIKVTAAKNTTTSTRTGKVTVTCGTATATYSLTQNNYTISLNKTSATGGNASGGGDTITVTANADWTAQSDSGWLTFTPASGKSGTTKVTVTYAENKTTSTRKGTITFTCGTKKPTYTLTQNTYGKVAVASISVPKTSYTVSETVPYTITVSGGKAPYTVKVVEYLNGSYKWDRTYTGSTTSYSYIADFKTGGTNYIIATVTDSLGNTATKQSGNVTVIEPISFSPAFSNLNGNNYAISYLVNEYSHYAYSANTFTGTQVEVMPSTELKLYAVGTNSNGDTYAKIVYNGQTLYIPMWKVAGNWTGGAWTALSSVSSTYMYPGGARAGSIDAGDTVYTLQENNGWRQVMYNISGGNWKIAWYQFSGPVVTPTPGDGTIAALISIMERELDLEIGDAQLDNPNSPYYNRYGNSGKAWCGYFARWCLVQAGISVDEPDYPSAPGWATELAWNNRFILARNNIDGWQSSANSSWKVSGLAHQLYYVPRPGDVFFVRDEDTSGQYNGGPDHIGLVWKVSSDGSTFWSIEGNTGSDYKVKQHKWIRNSEDGTWYQEGWRTTWCVLGFARWY